MEARDFSRVRLHWMESAILFAHLIFTLAAPEYIWIIIGI